MQFNMENCHSQMPYKKIDQCNKDQVQRMVSDFT